MDILAFSMFSERLKLFLNIGAELASLLSKGRDVLIKLMLVNGMAILLMQ